MSPRSETVARILDSMIFPRDTDPSARRAHDLHTRRMLAWLVKQDRYRAERPPFDGGRRGTGRVVTSTWYVEAADRREADEAVKARGAKREIPPDATVSDGEGRRLS